jgi:hypothetical protein
VVIGIISVVVAFAVAAWAIRRIWRAMLEVFRSGRQG